MLGLTLDFPPTLEFQGPAPLVQAGILSESLYSYLQNKAMPLNLRASISTQSICCLTVTQAFPITTNTALALEHLSEAQQSLFATLHHKNHLPFYIKLGLCVWYFTRMQLCLFYSLHSTTWWSLLSHQWQPVCVYKLKSIIKVFHNTWEFHS